MLDNPLSLVGLIQQHMIWYPLMELRDVYKLIYQGVMGSEHLISSPEEFSRYLAEEFYPLLPDPSERILEPIRPDRTLLRINLRAYKCQQQQLDVLIPLLIETARSFTGDLNELQVTWMSFVQACEQGWISNFNIKEIHQFTEWLEGLGFPAVHHSEAYGCEYQPAYRLISARCIPALGLTDAG
jgi:hypothetical protein